jgi:hypothetical protein
MRNSGLLIAALAAGALLQTSVVTSASAQGIFGGGAAKSSAAPMTRDQVRVRLLDSCVLTQTKPGVDGGAAPQCRCYTAAVTKAMTAEEVAAYSGKMPKRMEPLAEASWAKCQAAR